MQLYRRASPRAECRDRRTWHVARRDLYGPVRASIEINDAICDMRTVEQSRCFLFVFPTPHIHDSRLTARLTCQAATWHHWKARKIHSSKIASRTSDCRSPEHQNALVLWLQVEAPGDWGERRRLALAPSLCPVYVCLCRPSPRSHLRRRLHHLCTCTTSGRHVLTPAPSTHLHGRLWTLQPSPRVHHQRRKSPQRGRRKEGHHSRGRPILDLLATKKAIDREDDGGDPTANCDRAPPRVTGMLASATALKWAPSWAGTIVGGHHREHGTGARRHAPFSDRHQTSTSSAQVTTKTYEGRAREVSPAAALLLGRWDAPRVESAAKLDEVARLHASPRRALHSREKRSGRFMCGVCGGGGSSAACVARAIRVRRLVCATGSLPPGPCTPAGTGGV